MDYTRGDIFFVNRGNGFPTGSEMDADRPAIIVSNDACNRSSPVVEVVYLTTQNKKPLPTHVSVKARTLSTALCEQVHSVSKDRLSDFIRKLTDKEMETIDKALMISFGLKFSDPIPAPAPVVEVETPNVELIKVRAEREIYKSLYEQLLGKVVSGGLN